MGLCLWAVLIPTCFAETDKHKSILILGDSLSAAYGIPTEKSWVNLLSQQLSNQHKSYTLVNASISGDTTDGGLQRLPKLLSHHTPAIVLIELGANDGLRGFPLNLIQNNLTQLVKQSQASGATVLLAGMKIPPNYGRHYTTGFHQLYHRVAKENDAVLIGFLLDGIADNPALMQADRIHPTVEAQPLMAKKIWEALSPHLPE